MRFIFIEIWRLFSSGFNVFAFIKNQKGKERMAIAVQNKNQ